jgi:hypothetical protein
VEEKVPTAVIAFDTDASRYCVSAVGGFISDEDVVPTPFAYAVLPSIQTPTERPGTFSMTF